MTSNGNRRMLTPFPVAVAGLGTLVPSTGPTGPQGISKLVTEGGLFSDIRDAASAVSVVRFSDVRHHPCEAGGELVPGR